MENTVIANRNFLENVANDLADFCVSFIKIEENCQQEVPQLGGSGTLVYVDRRYAIITADHVLNDLPNHGEVGISLSSTYRPKRHRFTIDMTGAKITIARGNLECIESAGPDLGLVLLPAHKVSTIKAYKSFYNLSKRRNQILSNPPVINPGTWFICGIPDEWTIDAPPEKGCEKIKVFRGICGAGIVTMEEQRDEFDYLYFETKYNKYYEGPQRYQGVSGGGLWQIIVDKSQDGEFTIKNKILSGVVFFQSDLENELRMIKCHGRKSIYEAVFNTLVKTIQSF
jgi:hypothetical protein